MLDVLKGLCKSNHEVVVDRNGDYEDHRPAEDALLTRHRVNLADECQH